ncbi:MAG TPA: HAD family phosphatase [Thermomicrobiales bacterium]|jgi:sugar-phosphatase
METGTERRFDAVIFDLDGTLVDTEPLHERSWTIALAELGLTMPEGEYRLYFSGRPGIQSCRERFGMSLEEAIATNDLVTQVYWELAAGNVAPMPGLTAFLDRLHGVPKAIATSARRSSATRMLAELGLNAAFDAVVTADDITHGKPHPEIFLTAAARLTVAPERCLVFEDSRAGLAAARAAGMTCVGLTTTVQILDDAHHVIDGYEDARLFDLLAGFPV